MASEHLHAAVDAFNAGRDAIGRFMASWCYWYMERFGDPIRHPRAEEQWMRDRDSWWLSAEDYLLIFCLAVLLSLLKPVLKNKIFGPVIERIGIRGEDIERTAESVFQLAYYFSSFVYCTYALWSKPYFTRPVLCWEQPFPNQIVADDERVVYVLGLGWYFHALFAHLFMDRRTKDFVAMLVHHLVTLTLMLVSYGAGYHRIGLLAVYSMDSADVLLHINKIVRFLDNWLDVKVDILKLLVFPPLLLSWIYFRLYFYVTHVVYPSSIQGVWYAGYENSHYWGFFNICLFTLLYLQIFWFYLILKTAIKHLVYGDRLDDERDISQSGRRKQE